MKAAVRFLDKEAQYRASMNADAERLGVHLSPMSIDELYALSEALCTVSDVLSGLRAQPRFRDEDAQDDPENKAGAALENIHDLINGTRTALTLEAETRVAGPDDINRLFCLLARSACEGFCTPAFALQEVTRIAGSVVLRRPTRASEA